MGTCWGPNLLLPAEEWYRRSQAELDKAAGIVLIFALARPMTDAEVGAILCDFLDVLGNRPDACLLGRLGPEDIGLFEAEQIQVVARHLGRKWNRELAEIGQPMVIGADGHDVRNNASRPDLHELVVGARLDLIVQQVHHTLGGVP